MIAVILLTKRWVRFGVQLGILLGAGLLLCGYGPTMQLYYRIGFPVPLLCLLGIAVLLAVLAALPAHQHNTRKTKKSLKPDSLDPEEGDGAAAFELRRPPCYWNPRRSFRLCGFALLPAGEKSG